MIQAETVNFGPSEKNGKTNLPAKLFGLKPNQKLLTQAVRIYLSNQRKAHAKAKTRGEVDLTKAKMFRQKGTGHARHGAQSAPIFVGGGKALGPSGRQNYQRKLSKKMTKLALASALSLKAEEKAVIIVKNLEKVKKTKEAAKLLGDGKNSKKTNLLILKKGMEKAARACRNLKNLQIIYAGSLNPFLILKSEKLYLAEEALKEMEDLWIKDQS
jgi:large subunit ribosomal protein L4